MELIIMVLEALKVPFIEADYPEGRVRHYVLGTKVLEVILP